MQILKKKSRKISHMQVQQNINSCNLNNNNNNNSNNNDDDDNRNNNKKTILMMIIIKIITTKINDDYKKVNKK